MFWFGLLYFASFILTLFRFCSMQCLPAALSQSTVCVAEYLCALPQSMLPCVGQGSFLGWIKHPCLSWVCSESSFLNLRVQEVCLSCIEIRLGVAGLALLHFQIACGFGACGDWSTQVGFVPVCWHEAGQCWRQLVRSGRAGHGTSGEGLQVQEGLLPLGSALPCPGRSCPACLWLCALIP